MSPAPHFTPHQFDEDDVNITDKRALPEFIKLLVASFALVLIVYLGLGFSLEFFVSRMSPETEQKIWSSLALGQQYRPDEPNDERTLFLQRLMDGLPDSTKPQAYDFKVFIIEDEDINAFAFPGGYIGITEGLINQLNSENELVFILGHELGHFQNRDHLRGMGRGLSALVISLFIFGQDSAVVSMFSDVTSATNLAFSRAAETKADLWGLQTVMEKYGHAGGVVSSFDALAPSKFERYIPDILLTHPHSEARAHELEALIKIRDYAVKEVVPLSLPEPFSKEKRENKKAAE